MIIVLYATLSTVKDSNTLIDVILCTLLQANLVCEFLFKLNSFLQSF